MNANLWYFTGHIVTGEKNRFGETFVDLLTGTFVTVGKTEEQAVEALKLRYAAEHPACEFRFGSIMACPETTSNKRKIAMVIRRNGTKDVRILN